MGNYLCFDSHAVLGHFRLLSSRIDLFGSYVLFSLFRPCDALHVFSLGTLRSNDADDNENVKKTIGLISTTTTSHVHHTFLYISVPFLHDYDVKMPNFAFYGGRKQATTKSYSLSELEFGPLKFSFRRVRLQLTK